MFLLEVIRDTYGGPSNGAAQLAASSLKGVPPLVVGCGVVTIAAFARFGMT